MLVTMQQILVYCSVWMTAVALRDCRVVRVVHTGVHVTRFLLRSHLAYACTSQNEAGAPLKLQAVSTDRVWKFLRWPLSTPIYARKRPQQEHVVIRLQSVGFAARLRRFRVSGLVDLLAKVGFESSLNTTAPV